METGQRTILIGLAFLVIGFGAGFYVGLSAGTQPKAPDPIAAAPFAPVSATMAGGLPPPHKGHTFTGNIEVPPHSDEAHRLADEMLADETCPCGGCDHMKIGQCGCDTARELAGVAAHLFERGNAGDAVLAKLAPRYGLEVSDELRARAAGMRLPNPQLVDGGPEQEPPVEAPTPEIPSDIQQVLRQPGVQRLTDVPTGARPHR